MSFTNSLQRFYQRNLAHGELAKHKGAYLTFFLAGYLAHMTMCSPSHANARTLSNAIQTSVEHSYAPHGLEKRL